MKVDRIRWIERLLGAAGILFLGVYGLVFLDGSIQSRVALKDFTAESNASDPAMPALPSSVRTASESAPGIPRMPGISLRVIESKSPLHRDSAIAELQVPRIGLDVPVFGNTSRKSLNRGAGWIAGTATPSDRAGTVGIAGHRDRFFRSLKKITRGDDIVLTTHGQVQRFIVDQIAVVTPKNTSLLRDRERRSLALVTCYPFSYIGPAPKRFVVHAHLKQQANTNQPSGAELEVGPGQTRNSFQEEHR